MTAGVLSCSMLAESAVIPVPSGLQRCSVPTWVYQQLTQRLQRVETNARSPSGSWQGSMSSQGPSVICRRAVPSDCME